MISKINMFLLPKVKYIKNTSKIKLHFKYIELDMTIYPYKQRDVGYFKMLFVIMRGFPLENNKKSVEGIITSN